jgi:hypothetical protein
MKIEGTSTKILKLAVKATRVTKLKRLINILKAIFYENKVCNCIDNKTNLHF